MEFLVLQKFVHPLFPKMFIYFLNNLIWPTKEDEGIGEFVVVLKCMHVCSVLFDRIIITNNTTLWFD